MSCFKCPKCGEKSYIFGEGGAQRTAEEMDMKLLGAVSESCHNWFHLAPILELWWLCLSLLYLRKDESFSKIRLLLQFPWISDAENILLGKHPNLVLLQMDNWHQFYICFIYIYIWAYGTQRLFFFNRYLLKSASEQVQTKASLSLYHHRTLHPRKRT